MVIPAGKKVNLFTKNFTQPLLQSSEELILNEDININISSNFEPLADNSSKLGAIVGQLSKEFLNFTVSGQFKELGFQLWTKSEPISISFTATLIRKTNAREDIMKPAEKLLKIPLPTIDPKTNNLIPPGPSITSLFNKSKGVTQALYGLKIGGLKLNPVVITSVEPTFKPEIDNTYGFMQVDLKFDIKTLYSATKDMITSMLDTVPEV